MSHPSDRESQILGGLWGSLVGDALGVPVEFLPRSTRIEDPVTGMRGDGTHRQPAGTWSDDGALLLCTVESLVEKGFDVDDLGRRFVGWYKEGLWSARGNVFDVGMATASALERIMAGTKAANAGGVRDSENGNGSLMRLLPVAVSHSREPIDVLLHAVHSASDVTHRHRRSEMACGFHALMVKNLLMGQSPQTAFRATIDQFSDFYSDADSRDQWASFQVLLDPTLADRSENEISSSGYVLHTLTAALWCLLTTATFRDCVLKAVNLGGDTDTTGSVAGGLAGVAYGVAGVPPPWISALPRREELDALFGRFITSCS